jgi:hypothetical protein
MLNLIVNDKIPENLLSRSNFKEEEFNTIVIKLNPAKDFISVLIPKFNDEEIQIYSI